VDDLSLCGSGCFRAGSTAASVLHRQVKRRGPWFILQRRITTPFEQAFHSGGASRTDCPVQWCGAILVLGINFGSGVEQALDGLHLPFRIPNGPFYVAIRCIV